jgi:hypothetical protein
MRATILNPPLVMVPQLISHPHHSSSPPLPTTSTLYHPLPPTGSRGHDSPLLFRVFRSARPARAASAHRRTRETRRPGMGHLLAGWLGFRVRVGWQFNCTFPPPKKIAGRFSCFGRTRKRILRFKVECISNTFSPCLQELIWKYCDSTPFLPNALTHICRSSDDRQLLARASECVHHDAAAVQDYYKLYSQVPDLSCCLCL